MGVDEFQVGGVVDPVIIKSVLFAHFDGAANRD
jgi:hypothetical protein